jgi:hypothetical protein
MMPISINAISKPRARSSPRKKGCDSAKKCEPAGGMMSPLRHAYEADWAWRCSAVAAVPCKMLQARSTSASLPWAITKYLPALT